MTARGLEFARAVVAGKIANRERLLRYFGKYLKKTDAERFQVMDQSARSPRAQRAKVTKVQMQT